VRFIKALVVIMGVLIIIGVAVLGVELAKRMNDPERAAEKAAEKAATAAAVSLSAGGKGAALGLPQGARIGEVLTVGSRLIVKVSLPAGDDRLYLLDPRSGAASVLLTTGGQDLLESLARP
jgi:hypothetical protein